MFRFRHTKTKIPQIIAVCGVSHGCGTTHFALALANFLQNKQNQATAYLEFNATKEISSLFSDNRSRVCGIDCYPEVLPGSLSEILEKPYAYFILDMGVLNSNTYLEFLRCGHRFVIGSASPWKQPEYLAFLETFHLKNRMNQENITFLGNFGIKDHQKSLAQAFRADVHPVPFLPNPFQLTPEDWLFFKKLLEFTIIPRTFGK